MSIKILIVEDEFIIANDLSLMLKNAGYQVVGIANSVIESIKIIKESKPEMVLLDIFLIGVLTGIDLAKQLRKDNIPFVYLSANSNQSVLEKANETKPYGFLVKPFREKDVLVALEIARYHHKNNKETLLWKEHQIQKKLMKITSGTEHWEQKYLTVAKALQEFVPFDYFSVALRNEKHEYLNGCSFFRIGFDQYQLIRFKEFSVISQLPLDEIRVLYQTLNEEHPNFYNNVDFKGKCNQDPIKKALSKAFFLKSSLDMPLGNVGKNRSFLTLFSKTSDAYEEKHIEFLTRMIPHLSLLSNSISIQPSNEELGNTTREKHTESQGSFTGIIGNSNLFLKVLDLTAHVAPMDTSVLLLGESGTGKEKIANELHRLSPRASEPLITVNCAALPSELIESELFGHEKGAFTGANKERVGKFELAHNGTIFLDEIGEVPLDMQVKLLRVLQEKEFERLGGNATIKVNVRVIAATNKNLEQEVANGNHRLDLYYRLNVFPITLPALRDRKEDIMPLANYFASSISKKMNKTYVGISKSMEASLKSYSWPGNIRELENVVEQSMIMNEYQTELRLRRTLDNPIFLKNSTGHQEEENIGSIETYKSFEEAQRDHIIKVLNYTDWKVSGPDGAATILKMNDKTLFAKMKRLGIEKQVGLKS